MANQRHPSVVTNGRIDANSQKEALASGIGTYDPTPSVVLFKYIYMCVCVCVCVCVCLYLFIYLFLLHFFLLLACLLAGDWIGINYGDWSYLLESSADD